jgi:hypothetical protein
MVAWPTEFAQVARKVSDVLIVQLPLLYTDGTRTIVSGSATSLGMWTETFLAWWRSCPLVKTSRV